MKLSSAGINEKDGLLKSITVVQITGISKVWTDADAIIAESPSVFEALDFLQNGFTTVIFSPDNNPSKLPELATNRFTRKSPVNTKAIRFFCFIEGKTNDYVESECNFGYRREFLVGRGEK